ncbi:acetyltransferase [Paenibacillus lentus]|uniref:acetyltransferase n=1 Tax=Paenibacillus lentus TaxID=1338368 RepID=UPI003667B2D2
MSEAKLVIWGCGGMGREVLALCKVLGRDVIGFLDERKEMRNRIVDGIPVLGDIEQVHKYKNDIEVVCSGVGDPVLKKRFADKTREGRFRFAPALVHPSVHLSYSPQLGMNSILCAGSVLSINVHVGNFVIVNTNVTLAHDAAIGEYSTISPGSNISGDVKLGEGVFIGTGSAIREKVTVGSWSIIGGGSFVKDDVPPNVLYAGVPAVYKKSKIKSLI